MIFFLNLIKLNNIRIIIHVIYYVFVFIFFFQSKIVTFKLSNN
jgi:hypothetical protein